jgi:type IV pilus assembly PilX-like protein
MRHGPRLLEAESGIALITGLLILMSLTTIGLFATNTTIVQQDISANLKASKQGFYLAEAGLQHARRFLMQQRDNWSSYATTTATPLIAITPLFNLGTYTVTVQDAGGGGLRVRSTGNTPGQASVVIEALLQYQPALFPGAAYASGTLTLSGGSTTDSFDSSVSGYTGYSPLAAGSHGNVRSSNGNIALSGNDTQVRGDATAGGSGTVSVSGGATVTGTTTHGAPPLTFPPVDTSPCGSPPDYSTSHGITGGNYNASTGALTASDGATVILASGTYCFRSVTLSGGSTLQVHDAVRIYLDIKNSGAQSDFSGDNSGGVVNTTGKAENLQIFSLSSSQRIMLSGSSQAYMAVYAPHSPITFVGGGDFYGAVVGNTITDSSGTKMHYDVHLSSLGGAGVVMLTWRQVL